MGNPIVVGQFETGLERRPVAPRRWWAFAFVVSVLLFLSAFVLLAEEARAAERSGGHQGGHNDAGPAKQPAPEQPARQAEPVKQAAEAVKQSAHEPIEQGADPAGRAAERPIQNAGSTKRSASDPIGQAAEPVKRVAEPVKDAERALEGPARDAGPVFNDVDRTLGGVPEKGVAGTAEPPVKEAKPIVGSLEGAAEPVIPPAKEAVEPVVRAVGDAVEAANEVADPALAPVDKRVARVLDTVEGAVGEATEPVGGVVGPVPEAAEPLGEAVRPVLAPVEEPIGSLPGALGEAVGQPPYASVPMGGAAALSDQPSPSWSRLGEGLASPEAALLAATPTGASSTPSDLPGLTTTPAAPGYVEGSPSDPVGGAEQATVMGKILSGARPLSAGRSGRFHFDAGGLLALEPAVLQGAPDRMPQPFPAGALPASGGSPSAAGSSNSGGGGLELLGILALLSALLLGGKMTWSARGFLKPNCALIPILERPG